MLPNLTNQYQQLDPRLAQAVEPFIVSEPKILLWNDALADGLGFKALSDADKADYFSGQKILPGSQPVACAYAGHQFGHFNPQLGDGRAHLLGEICLDNQCFELQLKGSGQTPYSRGGDGMCALGPALREYLMSEVMFHLKVPTTRVLAVVTTGDTVMRNQPLPGAVVTRVAESHIRVGTFEFFAARGQQDVVEKLADFVIKRHFPNLVGGGNKYLKLLDAVIEKQILLINDWLRVGFIHGVMNTDNTLLSGQTIDYGPCAMIGNYHPQAVFSSIDHQGRYAFAQQSTIMQWNMARLAECLIPLIDTDQELALKRAEKLIMGIEMRQQTAFVEMMNLKLGIDTGQQEALDSQWFDGFLNRLQSQQLDYTETFNQLQSDLSDDNDAKNLKADLGSYYQDWRDKIKPQDQSVTCEIMSRANPVIIPRNQLLENTLDEAVTNNNLEPFNKLLLALKTPYQMRLKNHPYRQTSEQYDAAYQTFCGT